MRGPRTDASPGTDDSSATKESVPLLTAPADGTPAVVDTAAGLAATVAALGAGHGPVAVDAERAHGFRYSQRAYLIQVRRAGAGTHLIDPIAFARTDGDGTVVAAADLSELRRAIVDAEWVVHAASQDLPCLAEVQLLPQRLFDTELAARLLGYPRVALGTMVEQTFGVRLLKEHSASDWSTRPLPPGWLTYAALDVELLAELRDALAAQLLEQGKQKWAEQEFAALVARAGETPPARIDPWRRTSGIHRVRTRRGLGYVAGLWYARDALARRLDRAPGKILPDAAISELAVLPHPDVAALRGLPTFRRRQARRYEAEWSTSLDAVRALPDGELPPLQLPSDGPPQARLWTVRDPVAAARLARVRAGLGERAEQVGVPVENLLAPDSVRRLAWSPPAEVTPESVDGALAAAGARPWQREQTRDLLATALSDPDRVER